MCEVLRCREADFVTFGETQSNSFHMSSMCAKLTAWCLIDRHWGITIKIQFSTYSISLFKFKEMESLCLKGNFTH